MKFDGSNGVVSGCCLLLLLILCACEQPLSKIGTMVAILLQIPFENFCQNKLYRLASLSDPTLRWRDMLDSELLALARTNTNLSARILIASIRINSLLVADSSFFGWLHFQMWLPHAEMLAICKIGVANYQDPLHSSLFRSSLD